MNRTPFFSFLTAVLMLAGILALLPYSEPDAALLKLKSLIDKNDPLFREAIKGGCSQLNVEENSYLATQILPFLLKTPTKEIDSNCTLLIAHNKKTRFYLVNDWYFKIKVFKTVEKVEVWNFDTALSIPKPLTLLPIGTFILAALFEFNYWGLLATLFSYILLSVGLDFISLTKIFNSQILNIVKTDLTPFGYILLVFWVTLQKRKPAVQKPKEVLFCKTVYFLSGIWNPVFFTLIRPLSEKIKKTKDFLWLQTGVILLSLYTIHNSNYKWNGFLQNLLLPRYLTFSLLFILTLRLIKKNKREYLDSLHFPNLIPPVLFICTGEILYRLIPHTFFIPSVFRIGFCLILSEYSNFYKFKRNLKSFDFLKGTGFIIFSSLFLLLNYETGVFNMLLVALNPRLHPSYLPFCAFAASMMITFLTGSISMSYFLLLFYTSSTSEPIVQSAVMEGMLAGALLSPFSLINLLVYSQDSLSPIKLMTLRFQQIKIPLLIASIVYFISALNSVDVLRPVTFLFCCLVILTLEFKKQNWNVGRFLPMLRNDPHST